MNDIPLVRTNNVDDINTSLIAVKKTISEKGDIREVNVDVSVHTDAVDEVTFGEMSPVTSNAVSVALSAESNNRNSAIANAIGNLDANSVGGSGKYISAISENDGVISATASNLVTLYDVSGSVHPTTENRYFEICRLSVPKGKYVLIGISGINLSISGTYNFRFIINNGVIDRTVRGNSDGGGGIINSVIINIDSPITIIAYGYGYSRYVNNTSAEQYANIQVLKIGE